MKLIAKLLFIFQLLFSFNTFANNNIILQDYITITGTPKYKKDFNNFSYVNPNAPKGGNVTLSTPVPFDNFNPFIFKGVAAYEASELNLDSLGIIPTDDIGTAYPLIAEKFEISKDESFIGFIINKNAKFHDGSSITADDVIFSYNSLIEKGAPIYKYYYSDVDRVEKINSHHIRFYFKENTKNRELALNLTSLKIFSAQDFENKEFDKPSITPPLGSGPYIIDKLEAGRFVTIKRNPDYWAKDLPTRKGFFNFDEIKYDYYQDSTITLQALFSENIDLRYEYIAKSWATAYNNDIIKTNKVKKLELENNKPARQQFFAFNTRKDKFKNNKVRQAINYAFNFPWANKNLFYNQYQRINSYFDNSIYAATDLPKGLELEILQNLNNPAPQEIFTTPVENIFRNDNLTDRENLKISVELLNQAGYDFINQVMTNLETKEPLEIEILINAVNGNSFTRVLLPFIENLRKIGIKTTTRTLEVNSYKNRLDNFNFDVIISGWGGISIPGNEQKDLWGSESAFINGSNNIMGIENKTIDEIIAKLIETKDNKLYNAYVKALDRVLLFNHYTIFNWYTNIDRVAFVNKFEYPDNNNNTGFNIHTWWLKEK